jgi:hypothetical protein
VLRHRVQGATPSNAEDVVLGESLGEQVRGGPAERVAQRGSVGERPGHDEGVLSR